MILRSMRAINHFQPGSPLSEDREIERFLDNRTEAAFSGLYLWLTPRLLRYFRMRGCDNSTAEELTQDVLFTVFRHAGTIRNRKMFRGWLYKVAKNTLLMRWRKLRRNVDAVALEDIGPDIRQPPMGGNNLGSEFGDLVANLARDEREILALRFVEGLDYSEIAAALDIPVGTAKWRVFNSKAKLSSQLKEKVR